MGKRKKRINKKVGVDMLAVKNLKTQDVNYVQAKKEDVLKAIKDSNNKNAKMMKMLAQ